MSPRSQLSHQSSWGPHRPGAAGHTSQQKALRQLLAHFAPALGSRERLRTTKVGPQGMGPELTYLDFIRPNFKGLDDAGQEVFDLLEVTVANTPRTVH